jgi:molecular chaperone DnaJ
MRYGGMATLALAGEDVPRAAATPPARRINLPREGVVAESERLRVRIPEGTENGGAIRLPGKGGAGRNGPPGDLYVTVRVTPHTYFERQGNDILGIVPITVKEAYAGAEIEVPTIHGPVRAKVPPGTQGRQKFRLRGHGVKDPRTGSAGDHIYTVRVMVPKSVTPAGTDAATLLDSLYEGTCGRLPKGL